jgi:hypothetical protein
MGGQALRCDLLTNNTEYPKHEGTQMKRISRRAVLKGGLAMPVLAAVGLPETETPVAVPLPAGPPQNNADQSALANVCYWTWERHVPHTAPTELREFMVRIVINMPRRWR